MTGLYMEVNGACHRKVAVEELACRLDQDFELHGELLACNRRNVIKSFVLSGDDGGAEQEKIVVKSFCLKNVLQKIIYSYVVPSKAKRAYLNGLKLVEMGCGTPSPLAYVEKWKKGLLQQCYYVTSYTPDSSIRQPLEVDFNKALAREFALLMAKMHDNGIVHHDLNFSNVLYHQSGNGYKLSVIDINRMTTKDPARLSWKDCMDDYVRWTDRKDLFGYVMQEYAVARKLDQEAFMKAVLQMKISHDRAWRRRKHWTGQLKKWFRMKF